MRFTLTRLLLITAAMQIPLFAVRPMISYRALELGADPAQLGIVVGAYSLIALFIAVPAGRWVDVRGEGIAMVLGIGSMAIVCLGLAFAGDLITIFALQLVFGAAQMSCIVGLQTSLANRGPAGGRSGRFASFIMILSFGQLVGPLGAGLIASLVGGNPGAEASQVVFLVSALFCVAGTIGSLRYLRAPRPKGGTGTAPEGRKASPVLALLRIQSMPHAMLVSLTVLTTIEILTAYLPAYGEEHGYSVAEVSLLLATRAAASLGSRFLLAWLIRLVGHKVLLISSTVAPAILMFVFPLVDNLWVLYMAMAIVGFGMGFGQPITMVWVANRVMAEARGAALALRMAGNRLGQMSLPPLVGAIAGATSLGSIFFSMAGLLLVSAVAAGRASFTESPPTESEQVDT